MPEALWFILFLQMFYYSFSRKCGSSRLLSTVNYFRNKRISDRTHQSKGRVQDYLSTIQPHLLLTITRWERLYILMISYLGFVAGSFFINQVVALYFIDWNTFRKISFSFWSVFLAFDFCRICVVIRFFHPRHNGQWPPTSTDFLSQMLSITIILLS